MTPPRRCAVIGGGFFGAAIALHLAGRGQSVSLIEREERLLRRVLRTSEAFTQSIRWLHEVKPDPDAILDLAVILTRALDYWDEARAPWQADTSRVALSAAAAELGDAADALQNAITASPWLGNHALSSSDLPGIWPRKIQ